MTRHRVLHFLWDGQVGGLQRALLQLLKGQSEADEWDVGVAFGQATGPYADAIGALGCTLIDLKMSSAADLPCALAAVPRLRQFDIHHFHAVEPSQLMASARCPDVTRVFTQRHGTYGAGEPLRKKARRAVAGVLMRRLLHGVAGNTQHATSYAQELYRLRDIPSQVIYDGMDLSLLTTKRDPVEVRRDCDIAPDAFVVGSTGVFKGWKRFDRLARLLDIRKDIDVLLVGDGPERHTYEALAGSYAGSDRLHVTGMVESVADYLQVMDVFVLPSTADESFGNSVVEAMAMGVPSVVFSDSPGICEHIQHGETGFIVDDLAGLARVVQDLGADKALGTEVGDAGA